MAVEDGSAEVPSEALTGSVVAISAVSVRFRAWRNSATSFWGACARFFHLSRLALASARSAVSVLTCAVGWTACRRWPSDAPTVTNATGRR